MLISRIFKNILFLSLFLIGYPCKSQTKIYRDIFLSTNDLNIKFQGNYVGGLDEKQSPKFLYSKSIEYDYFVTNKQELFNALKLAQNNEVIFIDGNANISLKKNETLVIDKKITLMSDRGINNSLGARIFSNYSIRPLIKIVTPDVNIYGLRLDGGDYNELPAGIDVKNYKGKIAYIKPVTEGINIKGNNVEILNCEIYGWSHAGIFIDNGSSNVRVKNNYIHNNRRRELGYGIGLNGSNVRIEYNLFINNRHDIAGTGIVNTSYFASNNIIIGDKDDHSFDMHGGKDRKDGTNIAGSEININKNIFFIRNGARAFVIRGIPTIHATFNENIIYEYFGDVRSKSLKSKLKNENIVHNIVGQRNSFGNLIVNDNKIIRK